MNTRRKKILVLSSLKHNVDSTLKSAISLAKHLDAKVDFLYVKKPTEIVNKESQLSAIRTINREQVEMEREMAKVLEPYAQRYDQQVKFKFSFGNVKNEVLNYLNKTNPDIVILGKRNVSPFKFRDDGLTDFILDNFEGPVLIAPKTQPLEPEKELSIGILNDKNIENIALQDLLSQSSNPLKSFTIIDQLEKDNWSSLSSSNGYTEFAFEKKDNVLSSVSNYIMKSKVNLLCFDRNDLNTTPHAQLLSSKEIINKINVPILFGGKTGFGLS